ncbi:MAG: TlyA family RNA methyltransferase [Actinomycetota bacterium]|nr:TlyA family RNA methyltransferase [Actinomycetota bacterium]
MRRRLDTELVRRGLVASRARAAAEIEAGRVVVSGAPATKAATLVAPAQPIAVLGPPPRFVGRGGEKLAAALERFEVAVAGRRALDAGASTGGFTDCLLQRGATSVVAVDVGHGQLHERLRADPRVIVRERTDIRALEAGDVGGPVQVVVADVSFISLRTVLPSLLALAVPGAAMVVLVKPQFEAGRREVSKGRGVVRDPTVWRQVLERVVDSVAAGGATIMGAMASPLTGADGNVEFLVHLLAPTPGSSPVGPGQPVDLDEVVAEAVEAYGT